MSIVPEEQRDAAEGLLGDTHLDPIGSCPVQERGGSLYIRLPAQLAKTWGIQKGDAIYLFSAPLEESLVAKAQHLVDADLEEE